MSFDKLLQEMMANEVAKALRPVHAALAELQAHGSIMARLASALGQSGQPVIKRGPGRPPKSAFAAAPVLTGEKRARKHGEKRDCSIIGCGRPALSKGFCNSHYQKFNMLKRTDRLPIDWVADAPANSVKNIALPRGRAGAKALTAAK